MGSIGTRRFGGVVAAALALLALLSPGATGPSASAQSLPVPLPAGVPDGYTLEREGRTTWVYPTAAELEVGRLKRVKRSAWTRLRNELGAPLAPELDLRIAVNPDDMQALAPEGQHLPSYATGVAFPEQGIVLVSLTEPASWLRSDVDHVLVHELSHVALHRAAAGRPVPRWFSEGLAIQQSGEHSLARLRVLWDGTLRGKLIPLAQLSSTFPGRHGEVSLAYAQAADLLGQLLQGEQGPARLQKLLAAVRRGDAFDAAFANSFGVSLVELERQWRAGLSHRFGRWPSILSGLTVVWVAAALLLVVGYVRVRRRHKQTLKRWEIEEAPLLTHAPQVPPPPPPEPAPRSVADDVLDAWTDQQRRESGVPTIMHEGRSYTLH